MSTARPQRDRSPMRIWDIGKWSSETNNNNNNVRKAISNEVHSKKGKWPFGKAMETFPHLLIGLNQSSIVRRVQSSMRTFICEGQREAPWISALSAGNTVEGTTRVDDHDANQISRRKIPSSAPLVRSTLERSQKWLPGDYCRRHIHFRT